MRPNRNVYETHQPARQGQSITILEFFGLLDFFLKFQFALLSGAMTTTVVNNSWKFLPVIFDYSVCLQKKTRREREKSFSEQNFPESNLQVFHLEVVNLSCIFKKQLYYNYLNGNSKIYNFSELKYETYFPWIKI